MHVLIQNTVVAHVAPVVAVKSFKQEKNACVIYSVAAVCINTDHCVKTLLDIIKLRVVFNQKLRVFKILGEKFKLFFSHLHTGWPITA